MGTSVRITAALIALALLGAGIWQLRSWTMSTHRTVDPESRIMVIADAESRRAEGGHTLLEMVTAKVLTCRLEVRAADPVGPIERGSDGRFRFTLQPDLDDSDRLQFRGCLEDWNVDHVLVDVLEMYEVAA